MSLPVIKIDLEISLRRLGKVIDGMQDAATTSRPGPDTGGTCPAGAVSCKLRIAIGRASSSGQARGALITVKPYRCVWAEVASKNPTDVVR